MLPGSCGFILQCRRRGLEGSVCAQVGSRARRRLNERLSALDGLGSHAAIVGAGLGRLPALELVEDFPDVGRLEILLQAMRWAEINCIFRT